MSWGLLLVALGVWMSLSGATKTLAAPSRDAVTRISGASRDKGDVLLTVAGTLIGFCGLVIAMVY